MIFKRLVFILLLVSVTAFSMEYEEDDESYEEDEYTYTEEDSEIDSLAIYVKLIAQEDKESSTALNVAGMTIGIVITSIGAFNFLLMSAVLDALGALSLESIGLSLYVSVPFFVIGLPILFYNNYRYNIHKEHAKKRDEYSEAAERYKARLEKREHHSFQFLLFPTVNFANASLGAQAVLLF